MNEFKFKAFIHKTKQIVDVEWIDFKNMQITFNSIDFKAFGLVETAKFGEFDLLQYSGYKDLQGNEIYTGHIIRIFDDKEANDGWNEEVSMHLGAFMAGDENLIANVHFRAEIIGDIYNDKIFLDYNY